MKEIKTPSNILIEEELFQRLSDKGFIVENIVVDSLFNENVENTLDLERFIQDYFNLDLAVRKLMKYSKTDLLEYKIMRLLDSNGGTIRLKDLLKELTYARASIHHALNSLQKKRFIEKVEKGSYVLTDAGRACVNESINEE
ncbi:MAG: helix-turn-helix domain-containing protein [Candidatus Helarchaeales archaeon]